MKSLLIATITLFTCATQIFCSASSSSSHEEENDDYLVQQCLRHAVANDGFAIVTYHDRVPADPYWYPNGPATGNQFGAALIPASPMVAAMVHVDRKLFNKRGSTAPYFKVDDTKALDLSTNFFATELCSYAHDEMYGKRYLLLCPHTEQAETVKTIIEGDADQPSTFNDMFTLVQKLLPATFVLFDAGVYCKNRAMQPIDRLVTEMRAFTETFRAIQREMQKTRPKPRSKSAKMITERRFTAERKSHIRTDSLDETKLRHYW